MHKIFIEFIMDLEFFVSFRFRELTECGTTHNMLCYHYDSDGRWIYITEDFDVNETFGFNPSFLSSSG